MRQQTRNLSNIQNPMKLNFSVHNLIMWHCLAYKCAYCYAKSSDWCVRGRAHFVDIKRCSNFITINVATKLFRLYDIIYMCTYRYAQQRRSTRNNGRSSSVAEIQKSYFNKYIAVFNVNMNSIDLKYILIRLCRTS